MKYLNLAYAINLFYKLAQDNSASLSRDSGETELKTVTSHPEFDKLATDIRPHIQQVIADADYSRDKPKGHSIKVAMVDSLVYTGIGYTESDFLKPVGLGAKPVLLFRMANFVDEIDFQRRSGVPARKIKFTTEEGCKDYAYELIIKAGGNGSKYNYEYYTGPKDRIVGNKDPNSNFSRWVIVTFKD